MHTLFVREHNRLADKISTYYQGRTDEEIYQLARKIVGAEMQAITYNEFLPALLGPMAPNVAAYNGYDASVDPSIANEVRYRQSNKSCWPARLIAYAPALPDS